MLGGFLALLSAASFALESATARRGVVTASVAQALSITIPIGVPIFLAVAAVSGYLGTVLGFSVEAVLLLSLAGMLHFVWGRYCNYRAVKAMGAALSGPVQQCSLLVTLVLAIWVLGEQLTPLRLIGIVLVVLGPALAYDRAGKAHDAAAPAPAGVASAVAAPAAVEADRVAAFRPKYAEGYLFALLSSTGYGVSPILVRSALESRGIEFSLAGGLISYCAATLVFALVLLWPGQLRHVIAMDRQSARWFVVSGVCVCFAQMLRYMALAVAPVSVVSPIQRLSLVFRVYFARLINPQHEVFGGRVLGATALSLAGALALSVSTEVVQSLLPLPDWLVAALNWRWP
ncbi:MAG: EamA family transporter [Burkholderiales bacterium]